MSKPPLPDHDPELYDCYREGDGFRLVPVPGFRSILLARVDRLIEHKHGLEDMPGWKAVEYAGALLESIDCVRHAGNSKGKVPAGQFPLLDAMVGTVTYEDPALGVLNIDSPLEAAMVIHKRVIREHKRMGFIRRERLALKRAIRDAETDEAALEAYMAATKEPGA